MFKTIISFCLMTSLTFAHADVSISIKQSVRSINLPKPSAHPVSKYPAGNNDKPFLKDGFDIEAYRNIAYPKEDIDDPDSTCVYWSCREYPCRCLVKEPICPENYVYNEFYRHCEPNKHCVHVFKGCGAGEVFSYEHCKCVCSIECASDEIRLPGVCLCGKGTHPVYNEWVAGRYFAEKSQHRVHGK